MVPGSMTQSTRPFWRSLRQGAYFVRAHAPAVVWGMVALGVALRLVRYLLRFPLWGDECMLAVNFLDAGYGDVIGPLQHFQVAPLLFLWTELSVVKLLGFSEWTLRLFPVLCGIGSVLLFRHFSGRLLAGIPWVLATGIFAVSYYPIRHGAEAKPYATDLLMALVVLTLAVEWWRRPHQARWLWLLTGAAPLAVGLSYPAVFVTCGVSLALALFVLRQRSLKTLAAFAAYNAVLLAALGAHYFGHVAAQREWAKEGGIDRMWEATFPPGNPIDFVVWAVDEHTGRMFAYPFGGERNASVLTFLCVVVAAVAMWRRGQKRLLALCLAPLALAFLAAVVRKYPYGGSARTMQFFAPAICLLAGSGMATLLAIFRTMRRRQAAIACGLLLLITFGFGSAVRDMLHPYKTKYDRNTAAFSRWLWTDNAHQAEVICISTDLGYDLFDGKWRSMAAVYRCNQRIYSKTHQGGPHTPRWDRINESYPLRCIVYGCEEIPPKESARQQWLSEMQTAFRLTEHYRHQVNPGVLGYGEVYEVYEFVPRSEKSAADFARRWTEGRGARLH